MAKYMSATEFADYTASQFASPEDQPNISDFEDYDYDYESWIHYGDYWIKPDGSVSTEPPVVPPTEPTAPGKPTTPPVVDESGDDSFASTWDWRTQQYIDKRDVDAADREDMMGGTGLGSFGNYWNTPWNQRFADQYKEANDGTGNLVYGLGNYILGGMGITSDPKMSKIGQYGGTALGGGIGGVIGANVLPFAEDFYADWRDKRTNEAYKDFIEDLGSTGYRSGRTAGSAYDVLSNWYGAHDISIADPANLAYTQAYLALQPAMSQKAFETRGGLTDVQSLADFILQQQGLAAGGYNIDPQRLADYVRSENALYNSANVTILDHGSPAQLVNYITGQGYVSPVVLEARDLAAAQAAAAAAAAANAKKTGSTSGGGDSSTDAYKESTSGSKKSTSSNKNYNDSSNYYDYGSGSDGSYSDYSGSPSKEEGKAGGPKSYN